MKSIMWRGGWNYSQNRSFITASEETWMFEWLQEEGWLLAWFISSRLGIPGHVYWPNTERFMAFLTPNIWEGIQPILNLIFTIYSLCVVSIKEVQSVPLADAASINHKFQFQRGNLSLPPGNGDFRSGVQGKALVLVLFTILLPFRQ